MEDQVTPETILQWLADAEAELGAGWRPRELPVILRVARQELQRLTADRAKELRETYLLAARDATNSFIWPRAKAVFEAEAERRYPDPPETTAKRGKERAV